jgi:hypothetical protein
VISRNILLPALLFSHHDVTQQVSFLHIIFLVHLSTLNTLLCCHADRCLELSPFLSSSFASICLGSFGLLAAQPVTPVLQVASCVPRLECPTPGALTFILCQIPCSVNVEILNRPLASTVSLAFNVCRLIPVNLLSHGERSYLPIVPYILTLLHNLTYKLEKERKVTKE